MVSLRFNPESILLAVHCVIDGDEQVLIYTRSNWEWYCKQAINTGKIASMSWTKKQQLCVIEEEGQATFTEFNFHYTTSMSDFNHKGQMNSAYVAFINGRDICLSPLSKQVIPPPLFEKKVTLAAFPTCLTLFGHTALAYSA